MTRKSIVGRQSNSIEAPTEEKCVHPVQRDESTRRQKNNRPALLLKTTRYGISEEVHQEHDRVHDRGGEETFPDPSLDDPSFPPRRPGKVRFRF